MNTSPLFPALSAFFSALPQPSPQRPASLDAIANYVRDRQGHGHAAALLFICTHNSRRSHMGQLLAAAAAAHCGVEGVETYSGGSEVTAFNPRAVAALRRAGFVIEHRASQAQTSNPRYLVRCGPGLPELELYSKCWDDPANPREGFAAIMNCAEADAACPLVAGASVRIALTYDDPKQADDTPGEAQRYDERVRQIGAEMLALFERLRR